MAWKASSWSRSWSPAAVLLDTAGSIMAVRSSPVARRYRCMAGPVRAPRTAARQMEAASVTTPSAVSQCWPGWRERKKASIG